MESKEYRMGSGRFASELLFRYGGWWLLLLSMTAVAGIVLGICLDLRWMVVGLMTVFVVIPMVLAFLYYYYGLRRECFVNTIPHKIDVSEDGITVLLRISASVQSESSDTDSLQENNDAELEYRREFFPFSAMSPYRIGNNSVIIPFRSPAKGFLWIPADAYDDEEILADTLRFIDSRISPIKTASKHEDIKGYE